ncbi:MAG: hypothetical protein KDA87_26635 [Planctomycetales bacterium]|nr:hypothetical protein [Planctomycetales bacterium]
MSSQLYRYQTKSIDGFLSQLVRYIANGGHYFYIRVKVPIGKDPQAAAEKLLDRYKIRKSRWQRKRRHLKETASIHLLLHRDVIVVILTKGRHEQFYLDHQSQVRDIRRTALKVFGYSVRYGFSEIERRRKVFIRLDAKAYRKLKVHMLSICAWDAYREKSEMERQFRNLRYQPYEPVFEQLLAIVKAVNRARRRRGFDAVDYRCLNNKRRLGPVFVDDEIVTAA